MTTYTGYVGGGPYYWSETYTQSYNITGVNTMGAAPGYSIPPGMTLQYALVSGNKGIEVYLSGTPTGTYSGQFQVTVYYSYWRSPAIYTKTVTVTFEYINITYPTYTHTIAYNANGGSGSMSNTTVTDYTSGNTNVTFASNGFTRANYNFTGWKISNAGTLYQPGNTYAVAGNSSVTAYAQWTLAIAKTNVNVNGSWVKGSVYVNVNGTWTESKKIYVKVNGVWEESTG